MSPEAQAQFLARLDEYEYRIEAMLDIWWPPHPSEALRTDWTRIIAGCAGVAISGALVGALVFSLKL